MLPDVYANLYQAHDRSHGSRRAARHGISGVKSHCDTVHEKEGQDICACQGSAAHEEPIRVYASAHVTRPGGVLLPAFPHLAGAQRMLTCKTESSHQQ